MNRKYINSINLKLQELKERNQAITLSPYYSLINHIFN